MPYVKIKLKTSVTTTSGRYYSCNDIFEAYANPDGSVRGINGAPTAVYKRGTDEQTIEVLPPNSWERVAEIG